MAFKLSEGPGKFVKILPFFPNCFALHLSTVISSSTAVFRIEKETWSQSRWMRESILCFSTRFAAQFYFTLVCLQKISNILQNSNTKKSEGKKMTLAVYEHF